MTTIIRIQKRDNPYVIVDKRAVSDARLSFKARGILTYLLSKPSDWHIRMGDMCKHSTDGIKSIQSGLKELRMFGYADLVTGGPEGGRHWIVRETPQIPLKSDKAEKALSGGSDKAKMGLSQNGIIPKRRHILSTDFVLKNDSVPNGGVDKKLTPEQLSKKAFVIDRQRAAVERRAEYLKKAFSSEAASGTHWDSEDKRKEWIALRQKARELDQEMINQPV